MPRLVYWLLGAILAWVLALSLTALVLAFLNALMGMKVFVV